MSENNELKELFDGVIPERLDEVLDLIDIHSAQFRRVGDKSGFNLNAGAYGAIQFTQRSLEQLWLFGFAGLYALHSLSGIIFFVKCKGLKLDLEEIDGVPKQKEENERFSKIIETIKGLNSAESEYDFNWPAGLPKPEDGKPKDTEQAAVFDLVLMATAYVFLHELKHVIFESEGNSPEDRLREELECDSFALEMMLSKIQDYSAKSGYPEGQVLMKRSISIALGSVFLAVATPRHNLGGTTTHPAVHDRWSATLGKIELEENDFYWLYFASLAIALLKHMKIVFPAQTVVSYKQVAMAAIKALEEGI
ncbi:MAG: phage exclusion protein [Hydrogenovibrio crunogenus]|uniref:Uncharacterized protein n=1 Tax=Hydrogenovibrio crunogenus (strain DSM 25203 / XCL-2) TaxID=317025 RepID=Q31IR0_HYDCU|nr:phage exclusion protein [Hydrogenovibrio crunogenus]